MGKTGISITASSISSHSLTAVLVRLFNFTGYWLLTTILHWLLPDTDSRIGTDRTGPDLHERPLY